MSRIVFLSFVFLFLMTGCAGVKKQKFDSLATSQIQTEDGILMSTSDSFPLPFKGKFIQHVSVQSSAGKTQFSVHLTLDPHIIKAVAFHQIFGRVYEFTWTSEGLEHSASKHLPPHFNPEFVLVDFLTAYAPLSLLQKQLIGSEISDTGNVREIRKGTTLLRQITRQAPFNGLWKKVHLRNLVYNYQLTIETIGLQ